MKYLVLILFAVLTTLAAKGQSVNDFVIVYLQNGYTIRGVLIEIDSNSHVIVKLKNDVISEFKFSEIKKIEINKEENDKVKYQSMQEVILREQAELQKKREEEKRKQEILKAEKRKRDEVIKETNRVLNKQLWEKDLANITSKNYISIGAGGYYEFVSDEAFNNLQNAYSYIYPSANPATFIGYEGFIEYNRNISQKKNILIALNYSNYASTTNYFIIDGRDDRIINIGFQKYTLNLGHYYYLNKSFQLALGSGLSYTQNIATTKIEERGDVLFGRNNFYGVPVFVTLRRAPLLRKTPISFYIKSSYVFNFLPELSARDASGFAAMAGISYILGK